MSCLGYKHFPVAIMQGIGSCRVWIDYYVFKNGPQFNKVNVILYLYFVCEFLLVSGCMSLFLSLSKCF